MSYKYSIKLLFGKLETSACPPPFLNELFPAYNGEPVILSEQECIVTFSTPQTPADLGPLVRVELISE
jgi:hypothetical protein